MKCATASDAAGRVNIVENIILLHEAAYLHTCPKLRVRVFPCEKNNENYEFRLLFYLFIYLFIFFCVFFVGGGTIIKTFANNVPGIIGIERVILLLGLLAHNRGWMIIKCRCNRRMDHSRSGYTGKQRMKRRYLQGHHKFCIRYDLLVCFSSFMSALALPEAANFNVARKWWIWCHSGLYVP